MSVLKYAIYTIPVQSRMPRLVSLVTKLNRPVETVVDFDFAGPVYNFVATLERLLSLETDFLCVLQDDIVIAEHFCEAVEEFAPVFFSEHPLAVLSFYSKNKAKIQRAQKKGEVIYQHLVTLGPESSTWLLASLIPAEIARQFCTFFHEMDRSNSFPDFVFMTLKDKLFISDDCLFSRFLAMRGYAAFCSSHSLVQHAGGLNSSLGHNHRPETGFYVAPNFIGEDADARKFLVAK